MIEGQLNWIKAADVLRDFVERGQQVRCLAYGQEINPESRAICKAKMRLKSEGGDGRDRIEHIVGEAEWSMRSDDAFPAQEFDFMLDHGSTRIHSNGNPSLAPTPVPRTNRSLIRRWR